MEEVAKKLQEANKLLKTADHLAYVTYPLVKDNKLIITILENLSLALINAMDALLYYDRLYKRIPPFSTNFNAKLDLFKRKCVSRYEMDNSYIKLIEELKQLIEERKKSSMEFIRKDKYVLFNRNLRTKTITLDAAKKYLNESKPFFNKVNTILKDVRAS